MCLHVTTLSRCTIIAMCYCYPVALSGSLYGRTAVWKVRRATKEAGGDKSEVTDSL